MNRAQDMQKPKLKPVDIRWLTNTVVESETVAKAREKKAAEDREDPRSCVKRFINNVEKQNNPNLKTLERRGHVTKTVTQSDLKKLQNTIFKNAPSKQKAYSVLCVLSRWTEAGNDASYWTLCPPPLPVFIKALVNPFGLRGRRWQELNFGTC